MDNSEFKDAMEISSEETNSENYFANGVDPDDIAPLWNLRQKTSLLDAFITLFRGSETDVILRLLVLTEMVSKVNPPSWGMAELRHAFGYLSETAFDTTLKRLREGNLIGYGRETNSYSVTPLGQKVQSAISLFLKNDDEEGVGMLTGMLYAGEIAGTLGSEEFEHLLYRLYQLENEIAEAIESSSEHRILKARERYESVWRYLEKATDIIKRIAKDAEKDRTIHKLAQQIGLAQSRLAKFTSIFQRSLNDIDRQRVHLGTSGVSTSDLNRYLMGLGIDELSGLLEGVRGTSVRLAFVLADIMADVAEYELVYKEREKPEDWVLPKPAESPETQEEVFQDGFAFLTALHEDLSIIDNEAALSFVVPKGSFEESSYRLSMASLIGDKTEARAGHVADFLGLPLRVSFEEGEDEVLRDGVKTISKGSFVRTDRTDGP